MNRTLKLVVIGTCFAALAFMVWFVRDTNRANAERDRQRDAEIDAKWKALGGEGAFSKKLQGR